ncbi:pyruvate dehydrogenase complex dihydrolipoamide acetyltransferase [Actinoallomurus spadix]|uniref:Acetyltransferase component of pyruvate dehydrogenase complex n=1 Tax=Actinoallomurus spadix TaxID=79912 RepID=A0ABN0XQV5_9ACTN|nr:pyruvate dehydrogenase complex dihydrolipoamide acetyltransferase [Actinoallomurus spadix]MCO5988284.1 pyruvate dehydrogenase complex dihydrolipoamide acetyltransferase [Actinoallomurus spadix]
MSEILMPRLSDTMEEGVISAWHKKPGDKVSAGEALVDIETDKALMEYEAYEDGVLGEILVAEGQTASIGAPIAILLGEGESAPPKAPAAPEAAPAANGQAAAPQQPAAAPAPAATATVPAQGAPAEASNDTRSRPPSSPLARRLARENDLDLTTITGSGPGGRIVRADIEAALKNAPAPAPAAPQAPSPATTAPAAAEDPDVERVPLSRIRKVTARRLTESMQSTPHFYLTRVVDVGALLAFRKTLNEALNPAKVSVNDLIVKACATALRANPVLNVSFTEDSLLVHKRVNVGVAVALEDGLVVPVIRDADRKTVSQIGAETRELAGRAREQRLTPQEMSGGTFTVSNLGMFGIDSFTAVINPPEAGILAVGATRKDVVVGDDGEFTARDRLTLTLSVDHRACDGATGAKFLGELAELLENPLRIIA